MNNSDEIKILFFFIELLKESINGQKRENIRSGINVSLTRTIKSWGDKIICGKVI